MTPDPNDQHEGNRTSDLRAMELLCGVLIGSILAVVLLVHFMA